MYIHHHHHHHHHHIITSSLSSSVLQLCAKFLFPVVVLSFKMGPCHCEVIYNFFFPIIANLWVYTVTIKNIDNSKQSYAMSSSPRSSVKISTQGMLNALCHKLEESSLYPVTPGSGLGLRPHKMSLSPPPTWNRLAKNQGVN